MDGPRTRTFTTFTAQHKYVDGGGGFGKASAGQDTSRGRRYDNLSTPYKKVVFGGLPWPMTEDLRGLNP